MVTEPVIIVHNELMLFQKQVDEMKFEVEKLKAKGKLKRTDRSGGGGSKDRSIENGPFNVMSGTLSFS